MLLRVDGRGKSALPLCEMHHLAAGLAAAVVALSAIAHAEETPPQYRASCPACALVGSDGPKNLEAFAAHTRRSGDSRLAEELIAAQSRAERMASGGVLAGLVVATGGLLFLPQRCPDIAIAQEPLCNLGRTHVAVMTAGATLTVMGALYLAVALPSAEEFVARVNTWNRAHPQTPWLPGGRGPPGGGVISGDAAPDAALHSREMEIISRRRPGSRWLEPSVYVPIMIGASCAAAGAWFLAEALEYRRAAANPQSDPQPLGGRVTPPPIDPVPGLTAGGCTALSFATALYMRFRPAPAAQAMQLQIGPGGVGLTGTFH